VCNADARDHSRVAKNDWRASEVVEESNAGAKKKLRDVDVDFVERFRRLPDGPITPKVQLAGWASSPT